MLSGLGLVWFQTVLINLGFAKIMGTIVGILVIIGGLIEVKDFFRYGEGFSLAISPKYAKMIKEKATHVTVPGAIFLGAFVALVELPCTGGPYLAITALLAKNFNLLAAGYLVLYNFIFVLPLIIVAALGYYHVGIANMMKWKQKEKEWMRLGAGILMVLLGAFLIYYYQVGL